MREKDLIELYGLPKDEVKAYRKTLTQDVDWFRVPEEHRPIQLCPIAYTDDGKWKVFEKFGLLKADAKPMQPAEKPVEELKQATVIRCDYPNIRVMLVKLPDGKTVFVNVNDARRFKPKLPIAVLQRGGRYFCEHRPTSIIRINQLIKRNEIQPSKDGQNA